MITNLGKNGQSIYMNIRIFDFLMDFKTLDRHF